MSLKTRFTVQSKMFAGMTGAEYKKECLANSVVSLGTVSNGSAAERVGCMAT